MNKVIFGLIGSVFLSGMLFGAEAAKDAATDFSKSSNKDLINMAGKVEPKDVASYNKEIAARVDEMTVKEAREFRTQLKEQEQKVYDDMKVKDFKARQKAIREAMPRGHKGGQGGPHGMQGGPQGGPQGGCMPPMGGPQGGQGGPMQGGPQGGPQGGFGGPHSSAEGDAPTMQGASMQGAQNGKLSITVSENS